jgi:hypothetical protein
MSSLPREEKGTQEERAKKGGEGGGEEGRGEERRGEEREGERRGKGLRLERLVVIIDKCSVHD